MAKNDLQVHLDVVSNFFVTKLISQDTYTAEKEIRKCIGKVHKLEYHDFTKVLCVGIFKDALVSMI